MDWIFIGGMLGSGFSEESMDSFMSKSRIYLDTCIREYGITMDSLLAKGLKCEHCEHNRNRKFYYYMYNTTTKAIKVLGSGCAKYVCDLQKKCRICKEYYPYSNSYCPDCGDNAIYIDGRRVRFGRLITNLNDTTVDKKRYLDFCYANIYGNIESDFSKFILENLNIEVPEVTYEYYKEGNFQNCSIYHVYLFSMRLKFIRGPIPDEQIKYIRSKCFKTCFACDKTFLVGINKRWDLIIRVMFKRYYICDSCNDIDFVISGKISRIVGLVSAPNMLSLLVGYFYANDDLLSTLIGKLFNLQRDIAVEDNIDIGSGKLENIDIVKMYTFEMFTYDFDLYSRDYVRDIVKSRCEFCGGINKIKLSIFTNGTECKCDTKCNPILLDIVRNIKECTFKELARDHRDICQVLIDSNPTNNNFVNNYTVNHQHLNTILFRYVEQFDIVPTKIEGDILVRIPGHFDNYNMEFSLGSMIKNLYDFACNILKVFSTEYIHYFSQYFTDDILQHRKLLYVMRDDLEIRKITEPLFKKLGNRRVKKPDRCISYINACKELVPNYIAKDDEAFFVRNKGLLEYYTFMNRLDETPLVVIYPEKKSGRRN